MAYYCDTQRQSSGKFAKFIGKQLCRSAFLNKVSDGRLIKKETPTQCFLRTLLGDCFEKKFFSTFFSVLYTPHSRNNWDFSRTVCFSKNWAFFAAHVWFLYNRAKTYWSATDRNNDYIDKLFMQAWTLQKLESFYDLFKVCVV